MVREGIKQKRRKLYKSLLEEYYLFFNGVV